MGYKVRNLKTFTSFSLETLVPEENFYRQVENVLISALYVIWFATRIQLSDSH